MDLASALIGARRVVALRLRPASSFSSNPVSVWTIKESQEMRTMQKEILAKNCVEIKWDNNESTKPTAPPPPPTTTTVTPR